MRGGPGGLCAASCSSSRTRVAGGGSGVSSADRVPTEMRSRPRAAANHAARLTASGAPLSSLAASSRPAHRAAPSRSGAMTSAEPGPSRRCSTRRASRVAPTQTSAGERESGRGSGGGATTSEPRPATGGRKASRVDPQDEKLSSAAQRPSSSAASRGRARCPADARSISGPRRPRRGARPPRRFASVRGAERSRAGPAEGPCQGNRVGEGL